MKIRALIAAACLAALAAGSASAETCTKTSGYSAWTTTAEGSIWSGCTPSAGDTFSITGTAEVVVDGTLTLNSGLSEIVCRDGGTLRLSAQAIIDFTSSSAGSRVFIGPGCTFQAQGLVLWSGRVGSALTYGTAPARATFTVAGAGSPTAVATTSDYVVFGDDNPASLSQTISQFVQTDSNPPAPGYFRPSHQRGVWAKVQALSSTSITYHTNAWADVDGGTAVGNAATSPFGGTRGPALTAATALTGNVRVRGGTLTKLQLDLASIDTDGDLSGHFVKWTTGACAGKADAILYFDGNTTPTADDIYVAGDASGCGLASIVIDHGARPGDPVSIVRAPTINGGNVAHVQVTGGSHAVERIRLTNLGAYQDAGGTGWLNFCNFCLVKDAASAAPPTGYWRDVDVAFPNVAAAGSATGAIGVLNWNPSATAIRFSEGWDTSGFELDRWYIHDQRLNSAGGTCPGTCEGVHGVLITGSTFAISRLRCERLGDDCIAWFSGSFGANTPNTLRVQHMIAQEIFTTAGANSQQCIDLSSGANASTDPLYTRAVISDAFLRGCDDGIINSNMLGSTFDRFLIGGTANNGGQIAASISTLSAVPNGVIATYPNQYRNMLVYQLNGASAGNSVNLNGRLINSVLAGNVVSVNGNRIGDPLEITESLVDYGADTFSSMLERFNSNAVLALPSVSLTDVVMLQAGGTNALFGSNFAGTTATSISLLRVFFGLNGIGGGVGFLANSDSVPVTANHVTIASITPVSAGMRGLGGTSNGATVTNTCVETTLAGALTGAANFGSARTATAIELPTIRPDAGDDVPLSAYLDGPVGTCERPRFVGLRQVGVEQLAGSHVSDSISLLTTDASLLRQISNSASGVSGGSSGMLGPR